MTGTGEVQTTDLQGPTLHFTTSADALRQADFHIVTVPTPIDASKQLREEYDLPLMGLGALEPADAVVLAIAHRPYRDGGWALVRKLLKPVGFVADVPALLDRSSTPDGITLWRL